MQSVISKYKPQLFVILYALLLVVLGYFFRSIFFNSITFGYDQARDAIQALSIWQGDAVKIIGPMTDIPGLYHGTLYWYLISPFYFLTYGNIYVVKLFMITFNLGITLVFYYVTKQITKSKAIALVACFFYIVSFEVNQYARWLSNPPPALLTTLLMYYSYWLLLQKKPTGLYLFFIAWSLSIHFEFFLIYHIVYLFIFVLLSIRTYWKEISVPKLLLSLFLSAVILSPFALAELKFSFQSTKALLSFIAQNKSLSGVFIPVIEGFWEKIVQSVYFNVISLNYILAGVVAAGGFIYAIKNYRHQRYLAFVIFWICSPLILFLFNKLGQYHVMIGNLFGTIILFSAIIVHFAQKYKFQKAVYALVLVPLLLFQLNTAQFHQKGDVLFSAHDQLLLRDEYKVIDWIYAQSGNRNFGIDTVSNPLFINTTWGFLFDSYGRQKYGKMPVWLGYPQEGVFGENVKYMKVDQLKGLQYYLIMEPPPGIPDFYIQRYPLYEDTRSVLVERKEIGKFIVEKRVLTKKDAYFSRELLDAIIKGEDTARLITQ